MFLKNFWYMIACSHEVGRDLFSRIVLGEPVLLYRKLDGSVVGIADRCIHRQVPLSAGRLIGEQVQCGYHGLKYDDTGKCVRIPGQANIPARACVKAYRVVEKDSIIWIWMGEPAQADLTAIPDHPMCSSPAYAGKMMCLSMDMHYQEGIDNLLDLSHVDFLHPETVGSQDVAETVPEYKIEENAITVKRVMLDVLNTPLFKMVMGIDRVDRTQELQYWPIGNTRITTTTWPAGSINKGQPLTVYTITQFTPSTDKTTLVFVGMYRDFDVANEKLSQAIIDGVWKTVHEDKAVADHIRRNWDPDAPMIDLAVDRAPLAARSMLRRLYEQQQQAAAAQ